MREKRQKPSGESSYQSVPDESLSIDEELSQLIKLRSEPSESAKVTHGFKMPVSTVKLLAGRETNYSGKGKFSLADRAYILGQYLPVKGPWFVDSVNSEAYVSQYSNDGSLFVAGFRGSRIKIYDVENNWKVRKDISAKRLRWTITDTSLSPDQKYLAYASLTPIVHIVDVSTGGTTSCANVTDIHEGLDFSRSHYDEFDDDEYGFGIFSIKFSVDGKEIITGTNNDSIYVYDLLANKISLRILAHTSDVNVVAFADETGHVILSGSDDTLCKVWDRRCLTGEKPAGVLAGHLDGITFIDSKGDGRYIISNSKDQSIKLWDIRKMSSSVKFSIPRKHEWDYRWMTYPLKHRFMKHPHDGSLATFRGHSVLRTLIRCYFSPSHSTGQKYIYTGSSDNCVYIYNIVTGELAAKLEWHDSIIRDCSWHPYNPTLVSSSWDGYIARWEASGDDAGPSCLEARNQGREDERFSFSFDL